MLNLDSCLNDKLPPLVGYNIRGASSFNQQCSIQILYRYLKTLKQH